MDLRYYIVPESIYLANHFYNEGISYVNFLKLNDGRYAISGRVEQDFPAKFQELVVYITTNNIPFEHRELNKSEIWIDESLPAIPLPS